MIKSIFLSILIALLAFQITLGQQAEQPSNQPQQQLYDSYMKKHKAQKIAAWVTLGAGIAMISGAIVTLSPSVDNGNLSGPTILTLVGVTSTIVSIPLFVSAGVNGRKARKIFEKGVVGWSHNRNCDAVTLAITF